MKISLCGGIVTRRSMLASASVHCLNESGAFLMCDVLFLMIELGFRIGFCDSNSKVSRTWEGEVEYYQFSVEDMSRNSATGFRITLGMKVGTPITREIEHWKDQEQSTDDNEFVRKRSHRLLR